MSTMTWKKYRKNVSHDRNMKKTCPLTAIVNSLKRRNDRMKLSSHEDQSRNKDNKSIALEMDNENNCSRDATEPIMKKTRRDISVVSGLSVKVSVQKYNSANYGYTKKSTAFTSGRRTDEKRKNTDES